jgi:large subunit ribosomal protein L22
LLAARQKAPHEHPREGNGKVRARLNPTCAARGARDQGKQVADAASILRFLPHSSARDVASVLKSATANAEANHGIPAERLWVVDASADEGPTLKRFRPRAQGRAFSINKPMTHITVTVSPKEA